MRALALAVWVLWFLPTEVNAQIMPADLVQSAVEQGCEPLAADFYDRPGAIYPPYVYGVFPGYWVAQSVAFWCKVPGSSRYKMVLQNNTDTRIQCPLVIPWRRRPNGLRIHHEEHVPLEGFQYVSDRSRTVEDPDTTEYAPLADVYDGAGYLFYCLDGEWVFYITH